jgi:hypothetical protein
MAEAHKWQTKTVAYEESALVAYMDEADDETRDVDLEPKRAVLITCSCGWTGWAEIGEDLTERHERHRRLASAKF